MSGIDDYFGAAGDMFSGSQDPDDYAPYLEKEAEKKRREQEREQTRLLREQQAAQAELQKSLQQTPPPPAVIDNHKPVPLPKPDPDDPLDKKSGDIKRQMDELQPMKLDQVYVEGDPERTMQNVTDYFYQTLGDQLVKVPISVLMGKADSIAAITGMSSAAVASNIHAGLLDKTGEAHAAESVMYGVPLGMLSLSNIPFQPPAYIKSSDDLMGWVQSVVTDYGVGKAQDKGAEFVIDRYPDKNEERQDPNN